MKNITFEIKQRIAVLSENDNRYSKQINVISWNGGKPQLDIRMWRVQQDGTQRPLKHGKRKLLCIPKFQIFCYIEFSQRQSLHIRV